METKFNTLEEKIAYQLGRLDGMLYHQRNVIQNLKLQYEKTYQKKLDFENSEKK